MPNSNNTLCLDKFYPEKDLKITDIVQQKDKILIRMKSILQVTAKRDSCSA